MISKNQFAFILLFVTSTSFAESVFYEEQQKGWHWYNAPIIPIEEETLEPQEEEVIFIETPSNPRDELEQFQETVETAKAQAVLDPTPENVKTYIELQNVVQQQATIFAQTWQQVLWSNPELDVSLEKPTNQVARKVFLDQHQIDKADAIQQWAQTHGLFYFFRSDCPYCQAFSPIIKQFEALYGVQIIPISLDGRGLPEYPDARSDNGAAERLGVSTVPALFAVDPSTQDVTPITFGLISQEELAERLWQLSETAGVQHEY